MVRSVLVTAMVCLLGACASTSPSRVVTTDPTSTESAQPLDGRLAHRGFENEALTTAGFEPGANASVGPERINRLEQLPAGLPVVVDNPYGDVRLRFGGYEDQVEIQGVLQQPDGAARIELTPVQDTANWRLQPRLPAGTVLAEGQRLDLVLFVAEGHSVTVSTENGLIEARGLKDLLNARSRNGSIRVRGIRGAMALETEFGEIEVALEQAPPGSQQRLRTRTGAITVGVTDDLNARIELATSAAFATEFSLQVQHLNGQEPNKHAQAVVGEPLADLEIGSLRGEIRLLRRSASFVPVSAVGAPLSGESEMKRSQAP